MAPAAASVFQRLYAIAAARYPAFAPQWLKSRGLFGAAWEREFSVDIAAVFGARGGPRWREAVHGYAEFSAEALRAQVFFEKTGRYQASSYAAVLKQCYRSADYMNERYLPGQYLAHYIWPHHYRMLRRFCREILPRVGGAVERFYEVGAGCGIYSQKTLALVPGCEGAAYDVSEYSLRFTRRVLAAHGLAGRCVGRRRDILKGRPEPAADFVISQEVLEHLEEPQLFVRRLFAMTRPGGWGYITAAVNAAHTDHIYLYRSPGEVRRHITAAGWSVADAQVETAYADKPVRFRPTVCAFLVRRK